MADGFEIKGAKELGERLAKMASKVPEKVAKALYAEALGLQKISMSRTPVDTGALRASHETKPAKVSGRDISTQILVGGPSAPYAGIVHEDLTAKHEVGEAKFLERTLMEAAPFIGQNIADAIDMEKLI